MRKIKELFIYSLPIIYIIGSLSHFIYDWSNKNLLIGLISPVNESIYEHTKLAIIPLVIFYLYLYIKDSKNRYKILNCFLISLFVTILLMPIFYYFYTGAFGFESMIIDIIIYFISITIGQLLSLYFYIRSNRVLNLKSSLIIIGIYFLINIIFTVVPPKLPLFQNPVDSTYGINK